REDACELVEESLRLVDVLEHLEADDEVERGPRVRKRADVGDLQGHPRTLVRPCRLDRRVGQVDADDLGRARRREPTHAVPDAATGIEHPPSGGEARAEPVPAQMLGLDELAAHELRHEALGHLVDTIREIRHRRTVTPVRRAFTRSNSNYDLFVTELAIVLARRQNAFFRELAEALRDELAELGIAASISTSGFPPLRQDLAYALLPPHEFFHLEGRRRPPTDEQLARTIFICAEQPETSFFGENVELAPRAHRVFDINASGVRAFAANGIAAQHFQLGYTKSWDRFGTSDDRDVDIVFLGCLSERRTRYLAGYADVLARRRTRLVLSDNSQPNYAPRENFLADDAKWELLGRSKVLLNVHQDEIRYFEWLRVVQAILNGSVVVSEHSSGHLPLVPGVHYVSGRPEALGALADGLLVDEDARRTMQLAAYEMVRDEIPLRDAVSRVAEAATEIVARPIAVAREARRARADDGTDDFPPPPPSELAVTTDPDASAVRAALKEVAVDLLELRRRLTALERPDVAAAPRI